MRNFIYFIITSLFVSNALGQGAATRNTYAWSIGLHTGVTTYYGDLSYKLFLPNRNDIMSGKNLAALDSRAVGISLEKRLSGVFGLAINGLYGNVTGNDRTQNWGGNLVTDNPNFARSLNFRTEFYDANISLVYNAANGFLIRKNARFAPYLSAGVGITNFFVYGDLYTKEEGRYYYWTDGSIKDLAQNDPNAANAVAIAQDGAYETRTTSWKTEGKAYPTSVLNIPVALGVKYRLSDKWDLSLQASARYLMSDYFDDVSGAKYIETYDNPQHAYIANPNAANWSTKEHEYRGNTNKQNDIYGALTLGINYRLGLQLRKFKGPHYYSQEPYRKPLPAPVAATPTNQSVVVNVNGSTAPASAPVIIANPDERVGEMEQQLKDMQAMQGANSNAVKALNEEMLALKEEKKKLDNASSQPAGNNAELMAKMATLEARMDSVRESEIESQDNKINELELRLAQMEMRKDTVGVAAIRKEVVESKKNKEKLRRQRKSSNVEVKKLQEQVNEMDAKMDAMSKQAPAAPAKDPEVLKLRAEMEYMRTEMERLRTQQPMIIQQPAQQPIIVQQPAAAPTQTQPIIINNPAQAAAPQAPTIIQQPTNNAQLDQMTRTLDQMNRTLDMMSSRLNNLENRQPTIIQQPAAPAAAPVIVNTPQPAPSQTTTNTYVTSQVNVGLNRASIYFGNGSSTINRQDYATLDAIVNEMQKEGGLLCSVIGYASSNGNAAQNKVLSEKRAQNVRNYLVSKGVQSSRIITDALGSSLPVYNSNLDRRVEITIMNR